MVGYDTHSRKLTSSDVALAGGLSGFITRALCQPFDVLKIRFQLQVEPISKSSISKYHSILQALATIQREEGIRAFWKGHVPAQWLSVVYGSAQFWCFEIFTKQANNTGINSSHQHVSDFLCGAGAGGVATLVSFPFDVVRTRLVAQCENRKFYVGVLSSIKHIYANEGVLVLFRGLMPTIIQVAPHAGVQFMCYQIFKGVCERFLKIEHHTYSFTSSILSGSLAGFCAKTVIYPFDLVRKRMQIQGFQASRDHFGRKFTCRGMLDCFYKIYKREGYAGLFKGLSPSLIKAVVTSALHFSTFELICKTLEEQH